MNRRTQLRLKQLGIIIGAWLAVGLIISVYDHFVLLTANSKGPSPEYSIYISMASNLGSALIGALLGGSFLVFFINVRYQDKPYVYTVLTVTLSFIFVILLIIGILGIVFVPIRTGKPFSDPASIEAFKSFLQDTSRAKNIMIWSLVVAATQLMLQISNKFGPGAFGKIAKGKYNTPKKENRIFMFLDLNSSTAIAESLGNEKYHAFLKDFFADVTNPIIENKGEIYQYVGDEIVVSWKYEDGVKNNHCLRCFFDIKRYIRENELKYLHRFGLVPTFKAGIHAGRVVAGEVGIIKRDITYSGDVVNTASRILNLCKEFNSEVIVSVQLISNLRLTEDYVVQPLKYIQLRGKENKVMLCVVSCHESYEQTTAKSLVKRQSESSYALAMS